jgi:predicted HTH transcriptional regulator
MSRTVLTENEFTQVKETVFSYFSCHKSITNRKIRELTNISYDQAMNFFNRMAAQGHLKRVGTASSTKYVLPNLG